ncbi:MAG TPA: hypothetical protein VNT81_17890 [Vicinamibacterales bacterium]|nr:hypothetical protein [Vicinamibacterales bacterium]
MLTTTRLYMFIAFVLALATWTGAALHETIGSHPGWYSQPVRHVREAATAPGTINAWPFTTTFLLVTTLAAGIAFAGYRGPARVGVLVILAATAAILAATLAYFVPTLMRLANHAALSDAEIVSMSMTWMAVNLARLATLLVLVVSSLIVLRRLA